MPPTVGCVLALARLLTRSGTLDEFGFSESQLAIWGLQIQRLWQKAAVRTEQVAMRSSSAYYDGHRCRD